MEPAVAFDQLVVLLSEIDIDVALDQFSQKSHRPFDTPPDLIKFFRQALIVYDPAPTDRQAFQDLASVGCDSGPVIDHD